MATRDEYQLDFVALPVTQWLHSEAEESQNMCLEWKNFLREQNFETSHIQKFDFTKFPPVITDFQNRRFKIDFVNDKLNFHKKKGSLKSELISKAMGAGRMGTRILDLSAGLGIDTIFLSQMGFKVTAVERNPVVYLALQSAHRQLPSESRARIHFIFASAQKYLQSMREEFDVIYFDPMFPEKKKSALSKQEMMFFRHLVGADEDSTEVIELVFKIKKSKRLVVKRPLKAEPLFKKPTASFMGKLIRFDIYGVES